MVAMVTVAPGRRTWASAAVGRVATILPTRQAAAVVVYGVWGLVDGALNLGRRAAAVAIGCRTAGHQVGSQDIFRAGLATVAGWAAAEAARTSLYQ